MKFKTANEIINQVAVEVGLTKQSDVFASTDESFTRMVALTNACLSELGELYEWQITNRQATIAPLDYVAQGNPQGVYNLPTDFNYIVNQTMWDRTNDVPVTILSSQEWALLKGEDLVTYTIYASFRINQGKINIFPWAGETVPPDADSFDINYEYVSTSTVRRNGDEYDSEIENPGDIILFPHYMFERLLKMRFLASKGFDTSEAAQQYRASVVGRMGKDKGAPILNAVGRDVGPRLLSSYCNTPDSGYGG